MSDDDFRSGGEWTITCPESNEPHELRIPKHPFSPVQGVTCEKWHLFAWTEARALVLRSARGNLFGSD
jgi:hypothetical protein